MSDLEIDFSTEQPLDLSLKAYSKIEDQFQPEKEPLVSHGSSLITSRRKLSGWRFGVACSSGLAFTAFIVNTITLVVMYTKYGHTVKSGIGTFYDGSCSAVSLASTISHIGINAISSLLLSASNYTMQCLSSPTRNEIERAHARGCRVDIGVQSVRNIFGRISWKRVVLWWILALSSLPLHLLYNSVVFKTLQAYQYSVSRFESSELEQCAQTDLRIALSTLQNLTNDQCIEAYHKDLVTDRGSLILITRNVSTKTQEQNCLNESSPVAVGGYEYTACPYDWMCEPNEFESQQCDNYLKDVVEGKVIDWSPRGFEVDYCLSEPADEHCMLQFSTRILIIVIFCNILKSTAMLLAFVGQEENVLVTMGDAIASFLERPEKLSKGVCLAKEWPKLASTSPVKFAHRARQYWFVSADWRRWSAALAPCIAALATAIILLIFAAHYLQGNGLLQVGAGFGSVRTQSMMQNGLPVNGARGLIAAILLSNCPQVIVSYLYVAYNSVFTSMLLASEWSCYYLRSKPLRVTKPQGQQRSTYWLQLPYRYSLPMIVSFSTLHWLVSESLFLARVRYAVSIRTASSGMPIETTSTTGFSGLPILLTILLGACMLIVLVGMGFRQFNGPMPIVGSNSFLIAAACHRPGNDEDAALRPVSWGSVTPEDAPIDVVGHCCFTSEKVHDLTVGRSYA